MQSAGGSLPGIDPSLEVPCTIKPPVSLTATTTDDRSHVCTSLGPDSGSIRTPSGCQVIDVHMHSPTTESIQYITFQNYYTYSVTIKFQTRPVLGKRQSGWKTCVKDLKLMPNCHCEQGSQGGVILSEKQFLNSLDGVTQLRIILKQPSPHWREFGIRNLRCFLKPKPIPGNQEPNTGNMGIRLSTESGTLEQVSERMEKLLELGCSTTRNENDATHSRTNKLSYEINLLSYT